jgi:ribosomal protein S18 acetylase RimI-like enzyme
MIKQHIILPENLISKNYKNIESIKQDSNLDYQEIFNNIYLSIDEDQFRDWAWNVHFKLIIETNNYTLEIGKLRIVLLENPTVEIIEDSGILGEGIEETEITQECDEVLSNYDHFIQIVDLEINSQFRKFGLLNILINKLFEHYSNTKYISHVQYSSFGDNMVDNALLKRFYMSYGYKPNDLWTEFYKEIDWDDWDNLLVKTYE